MTDTGFRLFGEQERAYAKIKALEAENARLCRVIDIARTALLNIERLSEEGRASLTELLSRQEPTDVDVGCECGWRGKQSELMRPSLTSKERRCPECFTIFKRLP